MEYPKIQEAVYINLKVENSQQIPSLTSVLSPEMHTIIASAILAITLLDSTTVGLWTISAKLDEVFVIPGIIKVISRAYSWDW